MPETAAAIGVAAAAEGGADAAVAGGVAAGTAAGSAAGEGALIGSGLATAADVTGGVGLGAAGTAAGEGALIGSGLTGASDLTAAGATGASGIFGTGVTTGSSLADAAAQGVGINLGTDAVTGQTPTAQGVLEAAGTGAAGGALTGGLSGAPTTTPTSGAPALTGGVGAGAAASAAPASVTAGGGDAALGVGSADATAGVPPAAGAPAATTGSPASTSVGGGSPEGGGGGSGGAPTSGGSPTMLPPNTGGSVSATPAAYDFSNATPEVPQVAGQAQTSGFLGTGIGAGPAPVPEIGSPAVAATGTAASGPSSVMQAFKDPTWDNISSALGKNALTIGGVGLQAANFLSQPNAAKKANAAEQAQSDLAAQDLAQSKQLENYANSGTLPPGVQANLDQMRKSADAATASKYASIGNTGSSAQIQDMAAHRTAEAATVANIQESLMTQGIQLAGLAGTAYGNLYSQAVSTDNALQQSIATFAAALAGAGGGNTLKITQAA